jgi:hypothetical protein
MAWKCPDPAFGAFVGMQARKVLGSAVRLAIEVADSGK